MCASGGSAEGAASLGSARDTLAFFMSEDSRKAGASLVGIIGSEFRWVRVRGQGCWHLWGWILAEIGFLRDEHGWVCNGRLCQQGCLYFVDDVQKESGKAAASLYDLLRHGTSKWMFTKTRERQLP